MKIYLALLVALALASCSNVVSVQPVGEKPADFSKIKLAGIWADADEEGEEEIAFAVRDEKTGAMVYFEGEDEHVVLIRQSGDMIFANIKGEDDEDFTWCRLKFVKPDLLELQLPDPQRFSALVKEGRIKGRVVEHPDQIDEKGKVMPGHGFTVVLDDSKGDWVAALAAGKLGDAFAEKAEDKDVTLLKRVGGPLE